MSVCSNELVLKAFQRLGDFVITPIIIIIPIFVRDNSGNVALESRHPSLASQCVLRKEFLPHDKILENQPLAICMSFSTSVAILCELRFTDTKGLSASSRQRCGAS